MAKIFNLHNPEHQGVIREMIQNQYVLWLDVEMRKVDDEPALVGYIPIGTMLSNVRHVLCDPNLQDVAAFKGLPHVSWGEFVCLVVVPVIEAGGLVAAYSEHERELIEEVLLDLDRPDMVDRMLYLDCNAKESFRQHRLGELRRIRRVIQRRYDRGLITRKHRPGLKDFLMSNGTTYDYPKYLRDFSPASALCFIRPQARLRHPRFWTRSAKRKFAELLTYNEHDVRGMKQLTLELMQVGLVPDANVN